MLFDKENKDLRKKLEQGDKLLDKMSLSTEREILKVYQSSLKEIRALMAEIYAKLGDQTNYAEMQKYNRLKSLEKQIIELIKEMTGKNTKSLMGGLEDLINENYLITGYAFETALGVGLNYPLLNPELVKQSINNPISGLKLPERLTINRTNLIIKIRQEITQGLILGESYPKMAKRLKASLEGDATKAMVIVRTEGHRVQMEARNLSFEKAKKEGIEFDKIWSATLDQRTRFSHQGLDGQVADKDGYFNIRGHKAKYPGGFGVAEEDIRCRCRIRAQVKGLSSPKERMARDEKGKSVLVPHMTYNEWKAYRGF